MLEMAGESLYLAVSPLQDWPPNNIIIIPSMFYELGTTGALLLENMSLIRSVFLLLIHTWIKSRQRREKFKLTS